MFREKMKSQLDSFTIQFENIRVIVLYCESILTIVGRIWQQQHRREIGDGATQVTVTEFFHVRTRRGAQVETEVVVVHTLRKTTRHDVSDPDTIGATVQDANRSSLTQFQWPRLGFQVRREGRGCAW